MNISNSPIRIYFKILSYNYDLALHPTRPQNPISLLIKSKTNTAKMQKDLAHVLGLPRF